MSSSECVIIRAQFLFLILLIAITTLSCADSVSNEKPNGINRDDVHTKKTLDEAVDFILDYEISNENIVGAALGVIHNGTTRTYFYGRSSKTNTNKPDMETMFEIGSITKTFTAILLSDLEEKDLIRFSDPVQDYLPENVTLPMKDNAQMTLEHLVTHTASLPREAPNLDDYITDELNPYQLYPETALYDFLGNFSPEVNYGSAYQYSNIGFGLLGHVMGLITGKSYDEMVQESIFDVLGMNASIASNTHLSGNVAVGYKADSPTPQFQMSHCLSGAGIIKSNLEDMMTYLKAQLGIQSSSLDSAIGKTQEPLFDQYQGTIYSGMGWAIAFKDTGKTCYHDGGSPGQMSYIIFNKETMNGLVILTNTYNDKVLEDAIYIFDWMDQNTSRGEV
jgi:CubicO group peptidase (beta-lactamase class C family)